MHTHKAHIDTQNTVPVCAALLKGLLAPKSVSLTMPFRVTRALPPLRSRCTILWGEVNVEVEVEVCVCVCQGGGVVVVARVLKRGKRR